MKNIDDLIDSARELQDKGLNSGEIADELNVSRETANWLLSRAEHDEGDAPSDIHVDWSSLGKSAQRLDYVAKAMVDIILEDVDEEPEVVVGISKAGVPLASLVARELGSELAEYTPRKQKWEGDEYNELRGSFSRNFSSVEDRRCVIVDDVVTSGTTMTETIRFVEDNDGIPVSASVIANKSSKTSIDGVEINSLVEVFRVE